MLYTKKGYTIVEMMIVIALIGLFLAATSYLTQDSRIYQTNAERLANTVYDNIRNARNNMIIGRGILSGSTLLVTSQREVFISNTGIVTSYILMDSSTGTEVRLPSPFFDSDSKYQISEIAVSSGGIQNGVVPIWDGTGTTARITMSNTGMGLFVTGAPPISIRTMKITAAYAGMERSVIIDRMNGTIETRVNSQD